jgi:hypothetical protein
MRAAGIFVVATTLASSSLWSLGCDESSPRSSGGTGGASVSGTGGTGAPPNGGAGPGTGGAGTTPGTDAATSDTSTASMCKIPCLATIDSECLPEGACVEQPVALGLVSNRCYDNGVKILSQLALGLPTSTLKIIHRKADGSVCFTVEGTVKGTTEASVTWKDPAGTAVATGTYDITTMAATISCGNQQFSAQDALRCGATRNLPRAPGSPSSGGCTMGMCM